MLAGVLPEADRGAALAAPLFIAPMVRKGRIWNLRTPISSSRNRHGFRSNLR